MPRGCLCTWGTGALGGCSCGVPWQSHLPLSCPSGVAPEDQASYVCEARNVFGKVQAEAQLIVTGHGLLVDLRALGGGGQVLPGGTARLWAPPGSLSWPICWNK